MSAQSLPPEIWRQILDITFADDPILEPSLVNPLAESCWYEMLFGEFWLRKPHDITLFAQRKSYATKKVFPCLICVCVSV